MEEIPVIDYIQFDGGDTSVSSCGAGVYSPGTTHVPFRLITCQVTAGGKYSHIDDPLDLGKTGPQA